MKYYNTALSMSCAALHIRLRNGFYRNLESAMNHITENP